MTMGSVVTLGSVEFLEVVGGDFEVPPDEYFEVKKRSSQNWGENGVEEMSKIALQIGVHFQSTFTKLMHHTTN